MSARDPAMQSRREDRLDAAQIEAVIDQFPRLRVLVVGDLVLDEYLVGDVARISPEAPVPVVHVRSETRAPGGAANVARNLAVLGARCSVVGLVGDDADGEALRLELEATGVGVDGFVVEGGRPTTRKTRVVARAQQMLRFDRETDVPPAAASSARLADRAMAEAARVDAVIASDYAKGVFRGDAGGRLLEALTAGVAPVFIDPKHPHAALAGAALLKPNLREARRLVPALPAHAPIDELANAIRTALPGVDVVVTEGGFGMQVGAASGAGFAVPTLRREVYDVQGAGDTAMAALTLARLAGASLREAAVIANAAAAVAIGKSGTATASRGELRELLPAVLAAASEAKRER